MKRLQPLRWSGSVLSSGTRRWRATLPDRQHFFIRQQSSASSAVPSESPFIHESTPTENSIPSKPPSPPVTNALKSSKLAALHARLALPVRLPLQTLARSLVDPSADENIDFNNRAFSVLGTDLLTYYTAEHLICKYPRLPTSVLWAAMYSYIGERSLAAISKEWGVELAAEPGSEVDPGLLQFKRLPPGAPLRPPKEPTHRRGMGTKVVDDDAFGESPEEESDPEAIPGVKTSEASANFVRALMGSIYLHGGRPAAFQFFQEHFISRELSVGDLFSFAQPARDLSKLCAREGFERPVAKILSETGRLSRHPVFTVGVFSGQDKLGEGSGSSLTEARFRAAASGLKAWYLYSPLDVRVPSSMEDKDAKPWEPVYVDPGEVIV